MVVDLVSSEPAVMKTAEVNNIDPAPIIPPGINASVNGSGEPTVNSVTNKPPSVVGTGISNNHVFLPAALDHKQASSSSASSTAISTLQNSTPPAAANPWDNPYFTAPQAGPLHFHAASTTTSTALAAAAPTCTASAASTANAGSSGVLNETIVILEPCNAIYLSNVGNFAHANDEDWDMPPACGCVISVKDLTEHVSLFIPIFCCFVCVLFL
jgi:hypothetical protein